MKFLENGLIGPGEYLWARIGPMHALLYFLTNTTILEMIPPPTPDRRGKCSNDLENDETMKKLFVTILRYFWETFRTIVATPSASL